MTFLFSYETKGIFVATLDVKEEGGWGGVQIIDVKRGNLSMDVTTYL